MNYRVGSTIEYETFGGDVRCVVVEKKEPDVKKGRPGFVGKLASAPTDFCGVWGYDEQITRVVKY